MSYDFYYFLLKRPIDSLRDCSEHEVAEYTDWRTVRERIAAEIPELSWAENDAGYDASGNRLGHGRFDIRIRFDNSSEKYPLQYGMFYVRGS